MAIRILGESPIGDPYFLEGSNVLRLTPAGTMELGAVPTALGAPPRIAEWDAFLADSAVTRAYNSIDDTGFENYDGNRVFRFIRDYTGVQEPFNTARLEERADYLYYSYYNNTKPQSWLVYPEGLYRDFVLDGFTTALDVYIQWLDNLPWGYSQNSSHRSHVYSREHAYYLLTLVRAEQCAGRGNLDAMLGYSGSYPYTSRANLLLTNMENHMRQWRNYDFTNPNTSAFIQPFMVAITCFALIHYYQWSGNAQWPTGNWPNIPAAVQDVMTWMYDTAVVQPGPSASSAVGERLLIENYQGQGTGSTFRYIDRNGVDGSPTAAPELNMIIAPVYAWIAKHTGSTPYITGRADELFKGAVQFMVNNTSFLEGRSKQFNQFFYWASEYFNWRAQV